PGWISGGMQIGEQNGLHLLAPDFCGQRIQGAVPPRASAEGLIHPVARRQIKFFASHHLSIDGGSVPPMPHTETARFKPAKDLGMALSQKTPQIARSVSLKEMKSASDEAVRSVTCFQA